MSITPSDIEKKTFSTALRGYDLDEVDDFLDELVVAFRELQDQLAEAKAKASQPEQGGVAAAAPMAEPVPDESAVGRALVAAQEAADRIVAEAKEEAERILAGARTEADNFTRERDAKRAEVVAEMAEMNRLVANVRNELAVLATAVADKLDEMDAAIRAGGTEPEGGDEDGAPTTEWEEPAEDEVVDEERDEDEEAVMGEAAEEALDLETAEGEADGDEGEEEPF